MKPANDFSTFSAREYLKDFYPSLNPENEFLLKFYHDFYSSIPRQKTLLEIGGGPTIFQLISASRKVDEIIFSEYAQSCRDEVTLFIQNEPSAWNWDDYIRFEIGLEKSGESVDSMKELIRSKIKKVLPCDAFSVHPLAPESDREYDVLTMGGVLECISNTEKEFLSACTNTFSLLKPSGYFVGFFAKNLTKWTHNGKVFELFPINETYIEKLFPTLGLEIRTMTQSVPPDYHQEYEGIFAVSAIKKAK